MESVKETARAVTSKPMQRAVVNTVLLASGAISLFCLAAVASALFFRNFIPDQFVTAPVHLQYGSSSNPYGIAPLSTSLLKSQQDYDISVTLSLPRSPANTERGNFMISLHLLGTTSTDAVAASARKFANGQPDFEEHAVLFTSRRPTLVPYIDPVVSLASRLLFLLYHMLAPGTQTCTMIIPLGERVAFAKDSAIPTVAYIEVEAGQDIQIYSAVLTMTAQLRGLRWLMFHYRVSTFLAFTSLFWACEFLFMSVVWTALSALMGSSTSSGKKPQGKQDHYLEDDSGGGEDRDETSDYPQTFPTYGRQPPLKHEPDVKKEEERERTLAEIPMAGAEADDEDEDGDGVQRDSGIGTSYSEGEAAVFAGERPEII
ncbi:Seipin-like-like protein [Cladobotryum mycophilum]|uniref:Seipin-like-like protein n=1 Tax=Cladobotryum mycophilum TaxID=491253 RepID=A0ABR0STI1_9HYPO